MNPASAGAVTGRLWTVALCLAAAVFMISGVGWLLVPEVASVLMRMPLLAGDGLSTQIADLASFFLTMGGLIAVALVTKRSIWLYPVIMMLSFAACCRVLAWIHHGAGLPLDMVLVELVVAALLLVRARTMKSEAD